jgi:hypothetical protein
VDKNQNLPSHVNDDSENIAYTINHALACTTLDMLNTPVAMASQKYLGRKITLSYCPSCANGEHKKGYHASNDALSLRARRWLFAELAGDWGAILPTIAMQRYAPTTMLHIGKGLTYLLGDVFLYGATRTAKRWAKEQGLSPDDPRVETYKNNLYNHEIKHLPQAAVWTTTSTALTLGALRLQNDPYTFSSNATAKMIGASSSILGVLTARALMPKTVQSWDNWTNQNIFLPSTTWIGNKTGLFAEKESNSTNKKTWASKIQHTKANTEITSLY